MMAHFLKFLWMQLDTVNEYKKTILHAIDLGHKPRYHETGIMSDQYTCSCGWESRHYYDGKVYAFLDWVKHIKPILKSKQIQLPL